MNRHLDKCLDLRALLAAVEAARPVDAVDVLGRELATMLGATEVSLLITNFSGDAVVRMSHITATGQTRDGHNERAEALPLRGSLYEQVLEDQELDVRRGADLWQLLVPISERGDAIGILELTLPDAPDNKVVQFVESAAHALAYVLIASRRHTDLYEWAQRDTRFSLAVEIQRRLLPSAYTIEAGPFTVAGWLDRPPLSAATLSTTPWIANTSTRRSPMQWDIPPWQPYSPHSPSPASATPGERSPPPQSRLQR